MAFATHDKLLNGSRLEQFMVQGIGAAACFAWAFGCGLIIFKALKVLGIARVSAEDERIGLNASEHGATLGTGSLQAQLHAIISSERDLRRRLDESAGDETADIAMILNPFIAEMQRMLNEVSSQASNVSVTATQLADASQRSLSQAEQLADGTSSMTAAADRLNDRLGDLGTISGSMETTSQEVVHATKQMSSAMDQVTQLMDGLIRSVEDVAGSAQQGTAVSSNAKALVKAAQDAMHSLTAATREIEDITSLIEGFAEKTNLLALNATIEAARAGDAGRGFAVVAQEVKQLAHDTTRATDDIRNKVAQVRHSGSMTGNTVDQVRQIFETLDATMATIANAASNQSRIVSQVADEARSTFDSARGVVKSTDWMHENIESFTAMTTEMSRDAASVDAHSSKTHAFARDGLTGAREIAGAAGALDDVSRNLLTSAGRYRT
jgi:ammonium transporter, Amt family